MNKLMMGLAVAMLAAGSANAQDKPHKTMEDRAEMRTEQMVKELGLDEAQAEKVKAINAKYADKVKEHRQDHKEAADERREERMKLENARKEELRAVLTADQFQKLEAREKEMKKNYMEHRRAKGEMKGDKDNKTQQKVAPGVEK